MWKNRQFYYIQEYAHVKPQSAMTIGDLITRDSHDLSRISPTAHMDIELLIAASIGKERSYVISHPEYELSSKDLDSYNIFIQKRLNYTPVAQILGKKEFYGLDFTITEDTFVPRPETELIIDYVLAHINKNKLKECSILDIGTGTGCIPITLATQTNGAAIQACDISEKALKVAQLNAKKHKVHIDFVLSNLFSNISGVFNIITANLPYVPIEIYEQNKFLHHEPKNAITDNEDGLVYIKQVLREAKEHLAVKGIILFEMHFTQLKEISEVAQRNGLSYVDTLYDIQGFPRILVFSV